MNKITGEKQVFLIGFTLIWVLFELACGPAPEFRDKKPGKAKEEPVVVVKSKKPKKVEKPAPVFQSQAVITTADDKVYEVADFAFYSTHRSFSGGMYYPTSGSTKWPLYLKQGPIWKKIDFTKVKSMTFSKSETYDWLKINLLLLDGTQLQGLHPITAYRYLWYRQGNIYLTGTSEILGRTGAFKCTIGELLSLERLGEGTAEAPHKFKVVHKKKEQTETTVINPQFKITWTKAVPKYLDIYKLKSDMPITVNNTAIKIKPEEIESVTIPQKKSDLSTVKMKMGETVKIELPPRIFGKLKNGDILFTYMFENRKPVVKTIQIK